MRWDELTEERVGIPELLAKVIGPRGKVFRVVIIIGAFETIQFRFFKILSIIDRKRIILLEVINTGKECDYFSLNIE